MERRSHALHLLNQRGVSKADYLKKLRAALRLVPADVCFFDDLRRVLAIVDDKQDLELALELLRRLKTQRHVGITSARFHYGPLLVRALHHLQMVDEAISLFRSGEFADEFSNGTAALILMDLLYRNGK